MAQIAYKPSRFTYADYCTWPDEERWELIDGEAYAMSPAPARIHQEVVVELVRQIGNFLQGGLQGDRCRVYVAPFDIRLPHRDEVDAAVETVVQPDIAVICDPSKLDEKGCRGAPDWIIEVLSPATAAKDQIRKRALYERHGVREYWLVHPTDRVLFMYRLGADGYGKPDILPTVDSCTPAAIPDLVIDWKGVFTPTEKTE
ncbi:Uma2 family endonuclease [Candidatus Thiosymbion oneisti]|uniref:Uma2 family endonuclease n=1 Tax=Candidatus Thiosymbion oneisti TaxID=589554 RepID=UPI000ABC094C|nr:Uma2 family endonuclease [Candidatus Thiosymbion oneisti]